MTNSKLLKKKIKESGLKKYHIARALGMSRQTFNAYLNGEAEFRVSQMYTLCALLDIDAEQREAIFFDPNGAFKAT